MAAGGAGWLPDWLANRGAVIERLIGVLDAAAVGPSPDEVDAAPAIPTPPVSPVAPAVEPLRRAGERYAPWTPRAAILGCLPAGSVRQDGQDRVVWLSHRDPLTWTGYRAAQSRERQIDDIPLREIANAMRAQVAEAAGMGVGELHSAVLHVFGLVRWTAPVTARFDAAAGLVEREGLVRQEQGIFIPVARG
jgi:hypothetical protein